MGVGALHVPQGSCPLGMSTSNGFVGKVESLQDTQLYLDSRHVTTIIIYDTDNRHRRLFIYCVGVEQPNS